jgi:hypothetical protein
MYARLAQQHLADLLAQFPAVILLGPRQSGKTTLALAEMAGRSNALYLDLELPSAQRQLDDPEGFHLAAAGVGAIRKLLVAPVAAPYPMRDGIEVMDPLTAVQVAGSH